MDAGFTSPLIAKIRQVIARHSIFSALLVCLYIGLVVVISQLALHREQAPALLGFSLVATGIVFFLHKFGKLHLATVIGIALGLRLLFLPAAPSLSDDAYRYVWDGAVSARGINPFLYKPSDAELKAFRADPIYPLLNSADYYTVYPPVSQAYFWLGGLFYGSDWTASYYVIKILLVLTEMLALVLLARLTSTGALLLYAWHPLVLIETAGQAHTESALLFFLVLCIWFVRKNQGTLASMTLAMAGWIKLYPFVLFPFLWRRFRWRGIVPGGLLALVLLVPFYHPSFFSNIRASLDLYVRYFEFNAGVYYGVKEVFLWWTGDDWSKSLGPFFRMVFLLGLPAIYWLDYAKQWKLEKVFLVTIGFFLITSTTIHPWYFLGVILLLTLSDKIPWHWYWVASLSPGTYLLYIDGPYWPVVKAGWLGWLVLGLYFHRKKPAEELQALQRWRARKKVEHITALLPAMACGVKVLDLGAGEGYVGAHAAIQWQADVRLADVVDMNRTSLPLTLYDGKHLPFANDAFDVTILYFVLHHAVDPEPVMREALRVTRGKVVIVESVYEQIWDLRLLTFLDVMANRLRSGGLMNDQEEHLTFKKAPAWKKLIENLGGHVTVEHRKGAWVHRQHTFVVSANAG